MTMTVDDIINHTVGIEGGYVDDPDDTGGKTRYGVTEAVARKHGYTGHMRDLPLPKARAIFTDEYFYGCGLGEVFKLSPRVAQECFDTGVNMGVHWGCVFLQQALNALNNDEKLYPDIKEDGQVGPKTIASLAAYLKARANNNGERTLLKALNCLQGARYIQLRREKYLHGWLDSRIEIPA